MINSVSAIQSKTEYVNKQHRNNVGTPTFQKTHSEIQYKPISFAEGSELFFNGVEKQLSEIVHAVIDHPVKTIALIGATSVALMALPFVGIPAAVGGSVLALGFGGYALAKGTYHALEFAKSNKKGSYGIARAKLQQIGEDSVDIGLSVPFVPKAIKSVSQFAKYGKIGYNASLVADLKAANSIKQKWEIFKNASKNMSQSMSYRSAIDKELSKLEGITDTQKASIKRELLDFDVPEEKLPEVVLDKWAKIKGIKAKPDIKYATLQECTGGFATPKDCSITLNDRKRTIKGNTYDNYQTIKKELVNGKYEFTYRLKDTGNIVHDSIDKNIYDKYVNLYTQQTNFAPQSKQILATIHEREHIDQYARISANKGTDWINNLTPRAKDLYNKMAQDIPPAQPGTAEAQKVEALATATSNGTPVSYIKNFREIGARDAEWATLADSGFQRLNKVFTEANKTFIPNNNDKLVLVNGLRIESAKV